MNLLNSLWLKRKYWWPHGYRLKLFLSFLGVMILCGAGLIVLFGQIQRQTLLEETHSRGRYVSSILARSLETPLFFMNRAQIKANVDAVLEVTDLVAVFIYDKDGQRIFSSVSPQAGASTFGPDGLAQLAKFMTESFTPGEEEGSIHWHLGQFLVFGKRIISTEPSSDQASLFFDTGEQPESVVTDLGGVQLVFSLAKYQQGLGKIIRHAALVFLAFLPISLLIAFLLARDVVKPLRTLVESLRIRLGKREEEEEEEAHDELGQLDIRLKQLVGRLDQSFATIAQMNEGLEQLVAVRTAELTKAMQELKETQAQIAQTEKMAAVGQLVAGVAHEVNNTTNFVTGALAPLEKRLAELRSLLADQGKQAEPEPDRPDRPDRPNRIEELMKSIDLLLGNIREGARRTSKIVTDLKNFSRPDNDLVHQIDINHCLESTLALAMPEYRYRIELIKDLAPDLPMIAGSQGQLCQVFMNLIINAVHAQPDKGFLLIRTFRAEDGVHVVFADKGPGIPKKIQARIFEPFFTTKKIGTGLGLSISFGIINKHRGTILVRSEPGQGAEFEIILPEKLEPVIIQDKEDEI